jgi:hypothetical protein
MCDCLQPMHRDPPILDRLPDTPVHNATVRMRKLPERPPDIPELEWSSLP